MGARGGHHADWLRLIHGQHEAGLQQRLVQRVSQVDGVLGEQTELAEFLDGVTHRAGERLDERAAAGRARLVERDIVDALVADFEALDVLTANVDDEINIRAEMARRAEVRDRLDQTEIHAERILDERFAVAGDRRRTRYVRGRRTARTAW